MNLEQALKFSKLSIVETDGCTLAPELGITEYCTMHDHLLIHLVSMTHIINTNQIEYLMSIDSYSKAMTRLEADELFRQGLAKKAEDTVGLRRLGYRIIEWSYYGAVILRSLVFK